MEISFLTKDTALAMLGSALSLNGGRIDQMVLSCKGPFQFLINPSFGHIAKDRPNSTLEYESIKH